MKKRLIAGVLLISLVQAARASPLQSITVGYGNDFGNGDGVQSIRIGFQQAWRKKWFTEGAWHLTGYWEIELSYWETGSSPSSNNNLVELGLRPVLRLYRNPRANGEAQPFFEAGFGAHLVSETELGIKDFSTTFQFGSNLGAGVLFGAGGRFELAYRVLHLSNAGINEPNPGVTFNIVRLGYRF